MTSKLPDIAMLVELCEKAEGKVEAAHLVFDEAVAALAVLVGPTATGHACARAALEMMKLAEKEDRDEP